MGITVNPVIKPSYRWVRLAARPFRSRIQLPRQLLCQTGKSGGIYSLAINKSAPFLISDRLALFPDSTRIRNNALTMASHNLTSLADQYGTPLYIYDRATMDASVAAYQGALKAHYPAASDVTYAGKAFLCKAVAQWTQSHHLWLDCTGEGEIAIAVAGNAQRANILVHGVNKSVADLESAVSYAGTIVVDNLAELHRINNLFPNPDVPLPNLWLRLQPGIAV